MKKMMILVAVLATLLAAGCTTTVSEPTTQGPTNEELQQRIEELESQQGQKSTDNTSEGPSDTITGVNAGQSEPGVGSDAAEAARAAAVDYYEAAAAGNYEYTHSQLSSIDRSIFPLGDWVAANQALGSDQGTYVINNVTLSAPRTAEVEVIVSGESRYTRFIFEQGSWKHELSMDEVMMFSEAQFSTASADAQYQ